MRTGMGMEHERFDTLKTAKQEHKARAAAHTRHKSLLDSHNTHTQNTHTHTHTYTHTRRQLRIRHAQKSHTDTQTHTQTHTHTHAHTSCRAVTSPKSFSNS